MIEILNGLICFVTITVSFLYGTRVAWGCGKKCVFKESTEKRKRLLSESVPTATALYFFGFQVGFNYYFDGLVAILIYSLTSAILFSHLVVSIAMPELKRRPLSTEVAPRKIRIGINARKNEIGGPVFVRRRF